MKTPKNFWRALLLLIFLLVLGTARTQAVTFETVESSYLGNGWFQYDVKMFYDPFFLEADLVQFSINMTNGVDLQDGAPPANWTNDVDAGYWFYAGSAPQSRPNEQIFLMHSSATNYMLGTNAVTAFSLYTSEIYPGNVVTANIVGYDIVACLLPCPPAMADNSPTNHLETIVVIPDMVIKNLMVGPSTYGLVFDWPSDSTDLLQASPDMSHWTNVTYLYGTNGETVWTTNQHLLDNGRYFRLLLAAGIQTTNVAPLTASSVRTSSAIKNPPPTTTTTPRVMSCKPNGDIVSVQVATTPGQSGQVRMLNSHGVVLQTQSFTATSDSVVVTFNAKNVSGPMLFQAVTSVTVGD
jgi:hypothetical protein